MLRLLQELDEWMGVDQLIRKEIDIPNTTAKFLRFNIRYLINNEDGSYSQKSIEGVKSDQLRIIATEEEAQQLIQKEENVAKENEITELKSNNAGKEYFLIITTDLKCSSYLAKL